MEKPSKEMLGAIALVLALVGAGHLWAGAADACSLATSDLAAEMRKANGCAEFWVNRYQASIQTVISSTIGAVGLYFILAQLHALGDQNEMTRRALESNLRQQHAADRSIKVRAQIGLNAYSAATVGLVADLAKTETPGFDATVKFEAEKYSIAPLHNAEISAALHSQELLETWNQLFKEYGVLLIYVGLRFVRMTPDMGAKVAEHFENKPRDAVDAFVRLHVLANGFTRLYDRVATG